MVFEDFIFKTNATRTTYKHLLQQEKKEYSNRLSGYSSLRWSVIGSFSHQAETASLIHPSRTFCLPRLQYSKGRRKCNSPSLGDLPRSYLKFFQQYFCTLFSLWLNILKAQASGGIVSSFGKTGKRFFNEDLVQGMRHNGCWASPSDLSPQAATPTHSPGILRILVGYKSSTYDCNLWLNDV